ncbi:hydantoinase/oxoprolinase N-terminal domain-containing protein [Streptomyces buecherae]|uniref:hydantoinase/oxoprolinase N-terminal domain-containing protein n=1 Tax=Streptomyces buecherae TaxID=2763006 RepID=UPI0037AD878D
MLLSGSRVLAAARAPGRGRAVLTRVLAEVCGAHAAAVRHVTFDVGPALMAAVREPADGPGHGVDEGAARTVPVVAVRIAPRPARHPALARHPSAPIAGLVARSVTLPGGHDLLGRELAALDEARVGELARELAATGVRAVAVAGCGSLAAPAHERTVGERLLAAVPGLQISLSHEFGGQDLAGREASAVLNAALADVAEEVLGACEAAAGRVVPRAQHGVARGDGGRTPLARARTLPVVAVGAAEAAALLGAARLAGRERCRVLLPGPEGALLGEVRNGVPLVRPGRVPGWGVRLSVPMAILSAKGTALDGAGGGADSADAGAEAGAEAGDGDGGEPPLVVVAAGDGHPAHPAPAAGPGAATGPVSGAEPSAVHRVAGRDGRVSLSPPADLALIGTALCPPMAWVDEVVQVKDARELAAVRRDAEQRTIAMVTAQGAAPGSARLVETTVVALPFSPAGTMRVHLRAVGEAEPWAAEEAAAPDAAPDGTGAGDERVAGRSGVGGQRAREAREAGKAPAAHQVGEGRGARAAEGAHGGRRPRGPR